MPVPLAGWGRRIAAGLIDLLPPVVVLLWDPGLAAAVFTLAYLWLMGHLDGATGQSPGKALLGLRVVDGSGSPIGSRAGVMRRYLHVLDLVPLGLGFLLPLVHVRRQTFADRIMATFVVSGMKPRRLSLALWIPPRSG
ncbi:MAG TPA: RDD family protein [Acidimicrobiia bacterium]